MSTNKNLAILLHFTFFLSGICTVLIGQVLPVISTGFALNDLQAGYLFPAQFCGSILGTLTSNWFGRRSRFLLATIIGSLAMAAGLTAMNVVSFDALLGGFFVNGLGIGLTLPSVNLLVLEMNPARGASALSLLNFCWGAGAILCKPFVDATATNGSIFITTLTLAILLIFAAALIAFLPRDAETAVKAPRTDAPEPVSAAIWITGLAWAIALFNFIQVGFESGIGGWLTTYADRVNGEPVVHFFSPTFLYFLFFVAGRGVAPIYFRFMTENQVLLLDIVLMFAGMLTILFAVDLTWLSIGAAVSGFGASSVFPTNLARFTRTFGPAATRRATPLFVTGTLGGAVVTWLIGFVSNQAASLRAGMFVLLSCVAILVVVQILLAVRSHDSKMNLLQI
ncbi:MAG: sugar MFS transporter [Pyrinomonadaceae bacterium]